MKVSGLAWRIPFILGLLVLWCGARLLAVDPSLGIHQYNSRTWDRDNGLPVGAVNAVAVDNRGRLWLGGSRGLIYFDGTEFHPVELEGAGSTDGNIVTALKPRSAGGLWFGLHSGGYGFFDGEAVHSLPFSVAPHASFLVRDVQESRDGSLLAATTLAAVAADTSGRLDLLLGERFLDATAILEDSQGRIWIGTAEEDDMGVVRRERATDPDSSCIK